MQDPEVWSLKQTIRSLKYWASVIDREAATATARQASWDRFDKQVDPAITDPVQRAKAADCYRKAFYKEMALKSVEARRAKKAGAQ